MIVRVVYRQNKTVAVIWPAVESRRPREAKAKWLKRVFDKAMAQDPDLYGMPYDNIESSELPQDRENRNAWEGEKSKGIWVNQAKAEALKKQREVDELIEKGKV